MHIKNTVYIYDTGTLNDLDDIRVGPRFCSSYSLTKFFLFSKKLIIRAFQVQFKSRIINIKPIFGRMPQKGRVILRFTIVKIIIKKKKI